MIIWRFERTLHRFYLKYHCNVFRFFLKAVTSHRRGQPRVRWPKYSVLTNMTPLLVLTFIISPLRLWFWTPEGKGPMNSGLSVSQWHDFSKSSPRISLIFCMKIVDHWLKKVTSADFIRKFSFPQIWGFSPKISDLALAGIGLTTCILL